MMKKIILFAAIFLFVFCNLHLQAQNIGINATGAAPAASAGLDVDFTNKGFLAPRVALTNVTTYAPIVGAAVTGLLVYSTAAPTGGIGAGYYYWDIAAARWQGLFSAAIPGDAWQTIGNAGLTSGTNFIGTTDAVDLAVRTNNTERMRILSGGNVGIGITAPTRLFHLVGTAASPSSLGLVSNAGNGDALVSMGNSVAGYAAFWGNNASSSAGSGYGITTAASAIQGQVSAAGNYGFAVLGSVGGAAGRRIGGVLGTGPYVGQWASLGYQTSGNVSWGIYYSNAATGGAGTGAGKMMNPNDLNKTVSGMGIGGYADLLGAGIRGGKYGMYIQGERYGVYTDGKTYTNDIIAQIIIGNNNEKMVAYLSTSTDVDVYTKGTAILENGKSTVIFDEKYKNLISSKSPVIVTITPMGKCNGVYIESVTSDGFTVVENNEGKSKITFSYIAIGTRNGYEEIETPNELLSKDFESDMHKVINNENNPESETKTMWWDGSKLNFGSMPQNTRELQPAKVSEKN